MGNVENVVKSKAKLNYGEPSKSGSGIQACFGKWKVPGGFQIILQQSVVPMFTKPNASHCWDLVTTIQK